MNDNIISSLKIIKKIFLQRSEFWRNNYLNQKYCCTNNSYGCNADIFNK